ncbi:hypothetical protein J6590_029870 [Homalodisca vitripennis]|nr:hypothetical protein J6590_029870 [Homalodisca vitripennis]
MKHHARSRRGVASREPSAPAASCADNVHEEVIRTRGYTRAIRRADLFVWSSIYPCPPPGEISLSVTVAVWPSCLGFGTSVLAKNCFRSTELCMLWLIYHVEVFVEKHRILTFSSLYNYETTIYDRLHSANVINVVAIHDHNPRARVDLRQTQHRSTLAVATEQTSATLRYVTSNESFPPSKYTSIARQKN